MGKAIATLIALFSFTFGMIIISLLLFKTLLAGIAVGLITFGFLTFMIIDCAYESTLEDIGKIFNKLKCVNKE